METNESLDFFMRFLNERHNALKTAADELLVSLVSEDKAAKVKVNEKTFNAAQDLSRSLSAEDHPPWFKALIQHLSWFKGNHRSNRANYHLLKNIMPLHLHFTIMYGSSINPLPK